jgi:hypothetical protein
MNVSKDNNNGVEGRLEGERGATTHLRTRPDMNDKLFILGNGISVNKKLLNKYFPILVNRSSKTLYMLLLIVYAHPLRTVHGLVKRSFSNGETVAKNLNILIDMGYVQVENKPREIIPLKTWTIDKVYRITNKGVKALSAITGY